MDQARHPDTLCGTLSQWVYRQPILLLVQMYRRRRNATITVGCPPLAARRQRTGNDHENVQAAGILVVVAGNDGSACLARA